jgi:hypothetical protein
MTLFREVPKSGDSGAGDSSAALYHASETAAKSGERSILKPQEVASTTAPLDQPFHPLLATTNFPDFKDAFNGILNRFPAEAFASVEIPDALKDLVANNLKTRV